MAKVGWVQRSDSFLMESIFFLRNPQFCTCQEAEGIEERYYSVEPE